MKTLGSTMASAIFLLLSFGCTNTERLSESAPPKEIKQWSSEDTRDLAGLTAKRGLVSNSDKATPGYILFSPSDYSSYYLMTLDGEVVHEWKGDMETFIAYLQPNGNIIRGTRDPDFPTFNGGGQAGRIQEVTWDGEVIWDFEYATEDHLTHHDLAILPNGNVLAIAWEVVTREEAAKRGKSPEHLPNSGLWMDHIIEVEPTKPQGGNIVWEWHMSDHLVQDFDESKDNYGVISENPGKLDFNLHMLRPQMPQEQLEKMQEADHLPDNLTADNWLSEWGHTNTLDYNAELDQIVFGSLEFSEIYVIDHSTSTEEAKGSVGGKWGKGGDFLYRWGNPQNYDRGDSTDQKLFNQHDVKWIPDGYPGAGNLSIYNNNVPYQPSALPNLFYVFGGVKDHTAVPLKTWGNYSAIEELTPAMSEDRSYRLEENAAYGPGAAKRSYAAPDKFSFHSPFISGAHRMPNGNTFITEGATGRFFEVTPEGEKVWEYYNPYKLTTRLPTGKTATFPTGPFMYWQWRGTHIQLDHPALIGKTLAPIEPQPEVFVLPPPPE